MREDRAAGDKRPLPLPGPLVDGQWLATALEDPSTAPAVADVRWYLDGRSGRDSWERGHIPGAVWIDLDTVLAGRVGPGTGRHPLPDPEVLVADLAGMGIVPERPVVAYDDAGGSIAARLWWMLHTLGWAVALLDGGLGAWPGRLDAAVRTAANLAQGTRTGGDRPAPSSDAPWPAGTTVDTTTLAAGVAPRRNPALVLDARSADRFAGEPHPADPRAGHIPGARSAPWTGNVDPATARWFAPEALRRRFAALGVAPGTEVVSSCGSGVTACHNLFALHLAGLDRGAALYPGSWSAWAADPDLPVETGTST